MSSTELAEILALHAKWRHGAADGKRADLYGANLSGADLYGANLSGANLREKESRRRQIVPEVGAFEAFKRLANGVICRVRIPAEAGRVGGLTGRKCRAEWVEVIEGEGVSTHDGVTKYAPGRR